MSPPVSLWQFFASLLVRSSQRRAGTPVLFDTGQPEATTVEEEARESLKDATSYTRAVARNILHRAREKVDQKEP